MFHNSNVHFLVLLNIFPFLSSSASSYHCSCICLYPTGYFLIACFMGWLVTAGKHWRVLYIWGSTSKRTREVLCLWCATALFYHFKRNTVIRGEHWSQMAMFLDYLPKVVVVNSEHMNLLIAFCNDQLCYGNRCCLWRCLLVYIYSKQGISTICSSQIFLCTL